MYSLVRRLGLGIASLTKPLTVCYPVNLKPWSVYHPIKLQHEHTIMRGLSSSSGQQRRRRPAPDQGVLKSKQGALASRRSQKPRLLLTTLKGVGVVLRRPMVKRRIPPRSLVRHSKMFSMRKGEERTVHDPVLATFFQYKKDNKRIKKVDVTQREIPHLVFKRMFEGPERLTIEKLKKETNSRIYFPQQIDCRHIVVTAKDMEILENAVAKVQEWISKVTLKDGVEIDLATDKTFTYEEMRQLLSLKHIANIEKKAYETASEYEKLSIHTYVKDFKVGVKVQAESHDMLKTIEALVQDHFNKTDILDIDTPLDRCDLESSFVIELKDSLEQLGVQTKSEIIVSLVKHFPKDDSETNDENNVSVTNSEANGGIVPVTDYSLNLRVCIHSSTTDLQEISDKVREHITELCNDFIQKSHSQLQPEVSFTEDSASEMDRKTETDEITEIVTPLQKSHSQLQPEASFTEDSASEMDQKTETDEITEIVTPLQERIAKMNEKYQ